MIPTNTPATADFADDAFLCECMELLLVWTSGSVFDGEEDVIFDRCPLNDEAWHYEDNLGCLVDPVIAASLRIQLADARSLFYINARLALPWTDWSAKDQPSPLPLVPYLSSTLRPLSSSRSSTRSAWTFEADACSSLFAVDPWGVSTVSIASFWNQGPVPEPWNRVPKSELSTVSIGSFFERAEAVKSQKSTVSVGSFWESPTSLHNETSVTTVSHPFNNIGPVRLANGRIVYCSMFCEDSDYDETSSSASDAEGLTSHSEVLSASFSAVSPCSSQTSTVADANLPIGRIAHMSCSSSYYSDASNSDYDAPIAAAAENRTPSAVSACDCDLFHPEAETRTSFENELLTEHNTDEGYESTAEQRESGTAKIQRLFEECDRMEKSLTETRKKIVAML